ncbi:unnamed protein product [Protopolystoma xenopodis]|uniref:Uncharacterized protein n=1 Tax=Protopolystoma xenopodis TaxID=117903 RepID=A0A3S5AC84_9PLAT|nr:unnamed protein product [Protopolystoma xenopodis]
MIGALNLPNSPRPLLLSSSSLLLQRRPPLGFRVITRPSNISPADWLRLAGRAQLGVGCYEEANQAVRLKASLVTAARCQIAEQVVRTGRMQQISSVIQAGNNLDALLRCQLVR